MRTLPALAALALLFLAAPTPSRADDATRPLSLEFEDTELQDVIASIARFAGANVVVSPEATGKRVTVSLTNTPWKAALKQIVESAGFVLLEEPYGILRVVPRDAVAAHERSVVQATNELDTKRSDLATVQAELAAARRRLHEQVHASTKAGTVAKTQAEIERLATAARHLEAEVADIQRETDRLKSAFHRARKYLDEGRLRAAEARGLRERAAKAARQDEDLVAEVAKETARGPGPRSRLRRDARTALERADQLERAAEHLRNAGLFREAEHALRKAHEARSAARHDGPPDGNLTEAVHTLRGDVAALRKQVGQLTGLVRKLLERRRPPAEGPR